MDSPHYERSHWFATEVQPHEPMLRAWLHRRFAGQVEIDDIVQEAYVRVLLAHVAGPMASPNNRQNTSGLTFWLCRDGVNTKGKWYGLRSFAVLVWLFLKF